jgi:type II secretion system protein H
MRKSDPARFPPGFTLVELVVVMALLAIVAALSAPAMSRSIRARNLNGEAVRFIAATEYGRDEAVSQGVPMTVWIDPATQRFGVEPRAGFEGIESRNREFAVNADIHFEMDNAPAGGGIVQVAEFAPDGTPGTASLETVRLLDRFDSEVIVVRTKDGWGYEIQKETK